MLTRRISVSVTRVYHRLQRTLSDKSTSSLGEQLVPSTPQWSASEKFAAAATADPIDQATFDRVCALARLRPRDEAAARRELGRMLTFVTELQRVDDPDDGVEPCVSVSQAQRVPLQDDEASVHARAGADLLDSETLLRNATERRQDFIVVAASKTEETQ